MITKQKEEKICKEMVEKTPDAMVACEAAQNQPYPEDLQKQELIKIRQLIDGLQRDGVIKDDVKEKIEETCRIMMKKCPKYIDKFHTILRGL